MNNSRRRLNLLCFAVLLAPCWSIAQSLHQPPPPNLTLQKQLLIQYHDSGDYYHDISSVTQKALYYLKFRIHQNKQLDKPKQLAVVFDIDETAITNYNDMLHLDFGGTESNIEQLEAEGHDPAIPYTRTLYTFAKNNNVAVFFITGRREYLRKMTEKNLIDDGYDQWSGLFMKPDDYQQPSVSPYKTATRKKITQMGYDIILNLGDQESDLKGGYADMAFKLPDPFYLIS